MGSLLTKTIPFNATTAETVVATGTLSSVRERPDVDPRVWKGMVYNDGSSAVVIKLYGSADNDSWTQVGSSVTVKAAGKGVLSFAISGKYSYYKLTATGSTAATSGRIELYDFSGAFDR